MSVGVSIPYIVMNIFSLYFFPNTLFFQFMYFFSIYVLYEYENHYLCDLTMCWTVTLHLLI